MPGDVIAQTRSLILSLERHFVASAPALSSQSHPSGWLIRSSAGYTKRGNSAMPLDVITPLNSGTVAEFTELMGDRKVIRITPLAHEEDDALLHQLGWQRADPSIVMIRSLEPASPSARRETSKVTATEIVTPEWINGYAAASELPPSHADTLSQTLSLIQPPVSPAYLTMTEDPLSRSLAYGQVVKSGDIVGLFNIVVPKAYRGRGYGRKMTQSLLDWGADQGAKMAYLQVTDANVGARRLYETMGFKEAYPYHYRIAPERSM